MIAVDIQRNWNGSTTLDDTGNYLNIIRAITNSGSGTYTISGDLATLSSNCTQDSGTCTDTSNILELNQQYAAASGSILNVLGAGTGNLAVFDASNASANGISIDVQSSSSSQYALSVTSNNAAINGLYVRADGNVGIGTTAPGKLLDISNTGGAANLRLVGSGGNVEHTITDEYDINYTRTSGIAYMDFRAIPGDGTSTADYRFGLNSGSTGVNSIILFEANGSTVQTRISTSNQNTYFNAQGGNVGIGTTAPDEKLDVSGYVAFDSTSYASFQKVGTKGIVLPGAADLEWLTSTSGSGYGFRIYGNDPGGGTFLRIAGRANSTSFSDLVSISDSGNVGIGDTSPSVNLNVGTADTGHSLSGTGANADLLVSDDLELDGILYLDGGAIHNSAGTATITFTATPTTGFNTLTASSWRVDNTANVGKAALVVDQQKEGDLFTASSAGTPKFRIANDGNVTIVGSGTMLTVGAGSGKIDVGTVDPVYNIGGEKYAKRK